VRVVGFKLCRDSPCLEPMVAMRAHREQRQYRATSIRIDDPLPMGEGPTGNIRKSVIGLVRLF
jgi:hypothetical protein